MRYHSAPDKLDRVTTGSFPRRSRPYFRRLLRIPAGPSPTFGHLRRASMRQLAPIVVLVMLCACTICESRADTLIDREVRQTNPGGKDLVMRFQEIRRDERTSLAKVAYRSGASVPSSMFVVRGFYDIAKARGLKYFINLKEWNAPDGDHIYLVGFSNDKRVSIPEYFGFMEPPSVPDRHEFLGVDDFARLFEGQK
jgi:hypothetical protein